MMSILVLHSIARLRAYMRGGVLLLVAAILLPALPAWSAPLVLAEGAVSAVGLQTEFLQETGSPLTLAEAMRSHAEGDFRLPRRQVLNFGIGSRPVWVHFEVDNGSAAALPMRLVAGVTWLDRIDVYLVHGRRVGGQWHTGDETAGVPEPTPALGYVFPLGLEPGRSDVFMRVESIDPMVLPLRLETPAQLDSDKRITGYSYGFFYGYLAALAAFNLLLFLLLRERSHLYYALTLVSIALGNVAYTGHGLAWLWSGQTELQRYGILVLMVAYGAFGLVFSCSFLRLHEHAPRLRRAVLAGIGLGVAGMSLCVASGSHLGAVLLAFGFIGFFSVVSILLGIVTTARGRPSGKYFLAAALFGSLGAAATDLSVWGKIPFMAATYHGVEIGVALEATLWALALAFNIRQHQLTASRAEHLARHDSLTGLYNRRAALELASVQWSIADRRMRPASVLMFDLDHFKQINDRYGHHVGDRVLVETARVLMRNGRRGDIAARWGGEEFVLVLPETDIGQASVYAERLRQALAEIHLPVPCGTLGVTASFGVAGRTDQLSLDDAISIADQHLYEAKRQGRNRVCACVAGELDDSDGADGVATGAAGAQGAVAR